MTKHLRAIRSTAEYRATESQLKSNRNLTWDLVFDVVDSIFGRRTPEIRKEAISALSEDLQLAQR